MKSNWKNLLSVFGLAVCTGLFAGCQTDAAEDTKPGPKQENAKTPPPQTNAPEPNVAPKAEAVLAPAAANAQAQLNGTNLVVSNTQQTTVVAPIPPAMPTNLDLTKGVQEIVKLAQSGVSETVIMLYIDKATEPFNLDAADIIYLNDIGISSTVLAAMLNHDGASPDVQSTLANKTDAVGAPIAPTNAIAATPPQYEVSSNYVATAPPGGTVIDPNAQPAAQQVVVQPQPVVVQQPVIVQQPVVMAEPSVTYSYFYSSLAPYGGWIYVNDYGWCWQPTIAVSYRGWRPYSHGGRWLYSDAGWYWHSDYSWGWAPFHYGRWYCSPRFGWVWTPDYTWGPSWVTWRRAGDYCGWAPLPPRCDVRPGIGFTYWDRNVGFNFSFGLGYEHYTFVPTRHFAGRRVIDHVVPTEKTVNIYKDSTVVNNYIVGNNNTIINNGIGRDYVVSHTRSEIPKVAIRDEPRGGDRVIPPDRVQRAGNDLVVYRPTPPPARAETAIRQAREQIRPSAEGPSVLTGFAAGTPRPAVPETRTGMVEGRRPTTTTVTPRGEPARPGVAARLENPTFATPGPLRPETDRTAITTVRPSRTIAEPARTTPSTPTVRPGVSSGLLSTSPTGRPETITGTTAPQPSRPATVAPSRTEVGRGSSTPTVVAPAPGTPATTVPSVSRPSARPQITPAPLERQSVSTPPATTRPITPSVTQPTVRPAAPARSPDLVAPRSEPPARTITPAAPVQSANPAARPIPSGSSAVPRFSPQPNVTIAPQPIRPSTPIPQAIPSTTTVAPSVSTPRSESFGASRPSTAPITRSPSVSSPPVSAPPVRAETPRALNPAPAAPSRSIPSAPPAARPSAPQGSPSSQGSPAAQPNRPDGRGRVEVGR